MLAVLSTMQERQTDDLNRDICNSALQTFAYQTRTLGQLIAMLVHTHRQLWLAQSALPKSTLRALRSVPTEPGELQAVVFQINYKGDTK